MSTFNKIIIAVSSDSEDTNDILIKLHDSYLTQENRNNKCYCGICCIESFFDKQNRCELCGNPKGTKFTEKDELIETLTFENKHMAKALKILGLNNKQIDNICNCGYKHSISLLKELKNVIK